MRTRKAVIASEAKQSRLAFAASGLLRRFAPRNDGIIFTSSHRGEVAPQARVRGLFPSVETPYPLIPTLSPWERERAVHRVGGFARMEAS
jgi:hypothetical protein